MRRRARGASRAKSSSKNDTRRATLMSGYRCWCELQAGIKYIQEFSLTQSVLMLSRSLAEIVSDGERTLVEIPSSIAVLERSPARTT